MKNEAVTGKLCFTCVYCSYSFGR